MRIFANMKNVPQIVKDAAHDLIIMYGDTIDYLGKYEGADAYMYHFPEDSCTGYPFVYLVKDGTLFYCMGGMILRK